MNLTRAEAADLFTQAGERLRLDAQRACHSPNRWSVDVSILADAATRLGPVYDVLTATWHQAAYVKSMSPDVGHHLGLLFAKAADACATADPDPIMLALVLHYVGTPGDPIAAMKQVKTRRRNGNWPRNTRSAPEIQLDIYCDRPGSIFETDNEKALFRIAADLRSALEDTRRSRDTARSARADAHVDLAAALGRDRSLAWADLISLVASAVNDQQRTDELQHRVTTLETLVNGCDGEGCVQPHSAECTTAQQHAAEHDGCTCGSEPHAAHCWITTPPRPEVEQLRKQVAELVAARGSDPLEVARFDTVMYPAPDEAQDLIIGAVAADGRPVALMLDTENRRKVRGWINPSPDLPRPQTCPAGQHVDYLSTAKTDDECPWCRLARLEADSAHLAALRANGVDSWDGYVPAPEVTS